MDQKEEILPLRVGAYESKGIDWATKYLAGVAAAFGGPAPTVVSQEWIDPDGTTDDLGLAGDMAKGRIHAAAEPGDRIVRNRAVFSNGDRQVYEIRVRTIA